MGRYTSHSRVLLIDINGTELTLKIGTSENSVPVSVPTDETLAVSVPDGETIPTTLKNVNMQSGVRVPVSR